MPTAASAIARDHLEAFLAALTERVSPATVAKHYRSMQQLFRWMVEDGEIGHSPMERMRPPAVPEQPVDVFTDDELRALLDAARAAQCGLASGSRTRPRSSRSPCSRGLSARPPQGDPHRRARHRSAALAGSSILRGKKDMIL